MARTRDRIRGHMTRVLLGAHLSPLVWNPSFILALSSQSPSGRPAALPTATGWGEELLDRAAARSTSLLHGAAPSRYPRRDHPYVRSCFATKTE